LPVLPDAFFSPLISTKEADQSEKEPLTVTAKDTSLNEVIEKLWDLATNNSVNNHLQNESNQLQAEIKVLIEVNERQGISSRNLKIIEACINPNLSNNEETLKLIKLLTNDAADINHEVLQFIKAIIPELDQDNTSTHRLSQLVTDMQ
jgi:hypothetical protein